MTGNNDDWESWSKYVLKEVERLNDCYDGLSKEIVKIGKDIVGLKVKSGMWGVIGGMIPICVALLIWLARSVE